MIPVIDMHCDTISLLYTEGSRGSDEKQLSGTGALGQASGLRKNSLMLDLERMRTGGYACQCFALYSDLDKLRKEGRSPFEYTCGMLDLLDEELERNSDLIRPVTTGTEIEANMKKGLMSALRTVEEGAAFEGSIEKLRYLYDRGVRKATLTWNYENELAYPNCYVYDPVSGGYSFRGCDTEHGLKRKGFEFVCAMEAMGMLIDISHLGDAAIADVFDTVRKDTPIVASHSNARGICDHPRNLSDGMLRSLAEHGGVTGINYAHSIRRKGDAEDRSRISDMLRHMKYIRNVAGIDVLSLGSDFDGISGDLELSGAQDMQKLADAMSLDGFTTEEIEKVFYKNVLSLYKRVLTNR